MGLSQQKQLERSKIEAYFRETARVENAKKTKIPFESILDQGDKGKRILFVIPESIGDVFLCTSLFRSIKINYPWANLYVATKEQYFPVLKGNPYIFKVIPYIPALENLQFCEGSGDKNPGFFEIAFLPFIGVQRQHNYHHNCKTVIPYNMRLEENNL